MVRTKNQGQGVGRALIQPVRVKVRVGAVNPCHTEIFP